MKYHEDDRAQRLIDIFPQIRGVLKDGQLNVSYVSSTEHMVAWHAHEIQTDYWLCLKGRFKVGWATEEDGCEWKYLSDKNQKVLEIPPGTFHGYQALEPNSILLYYVTKAYDAKKPDEIRKPIGYFNEIWKVPNK